MPALKKLIVLLTLLTSGCATLYPDEENLVGSWEAVGLIPYCRLEFFDDGEGLLLSLWYDDEQATILKLHSYKILKTGFTIVGENIKNEEDPVTFYGEFYGRQLVINDQNDVESKIWFSRTIPVAELRAKADDEIKKYLKLKSTEPRKNEENLCPEKEAPQGESQCT